MVASVTQFDSAETVQVQSRVVDTAIEPLPPLGGNGADGAFVTATLHFAADGAVTDVDLDTETVFLSLTRAEVEGAPAFDASRADDESYRAALADYYLTMPALEGLVGDPTAYRER